MFKKPFSLEGRIGRAEYFFSYTAYFTALLGLELVAISSELGVLFSLVASVPLAWFVLAQGVKRCHDRGNNGWFQIIPGYLIWMMFAAGDPAENEYGPSPKQPAEQRV